MKDFMITLCIFLAMILAINFSINYLNHVCIDLKLVNTNVENYISSEDWKNANDKMLEFSAKWNKYSKIISLFVNHQELDNIEIEEAKLPEYIKEKTKDEALASTHVINFLIDHVAKLENINLQNLF
jgi:hypothetical protein